MKELKYIVTEELSSMKLADILKREMELSSRLIRQMKREKRVHVNGHKLSFNAKLRLNDIVTVELPEEENRFVAEPMDIMVLHEDKQFIVINKAPYIVVHPTKGHPFGTVANGIAYHMEQKNDQYKIRFANRLDRDTSGAMIICKSGFAQKIISDQMQDGSIVKQYIAVVEGCVKEETGTINAPIGRAYEDSVHRVVRQDGAPSITHYEVVERLSQHTVLKITLETGRTHQIRVHLKHLGHTIVGDELYGSNHQYLNRQALHACRLRFKDHEGKPLDIEAPLYEDMKALIEELRKI